MKNMKKNLLILTLIFAGIIISVNLSATELVLKIVQTHTDGETAVSYDDGEYENDTIDKMDDDDLDMGWEGDDLNIMTAYTRFQAVSIPQGAVIDSAFLIIYAHEDEADEAKITVYAEAIDDSPAFVEGEALDDRTWTTASINWTCTDPWTMWEQYRSPDVSDVIQEVINRDGWEAGNSLTLFMTGEDQGASLLDNARDFESFENIEDPDDGGDGLHHPERIPQLVIHYTVNTEPEEYIYTIIKTHDDGGIAVSYDDGEYENDTIDKMDDDDLDMGWEGDDLNIMTAYTRFQNIEIEKGTKIDSAVLVIYAHEDEADEAKITVYAEAVDNSAAFQEGEALEDRTWTTATVDWTCTDPWTMWEQYHSPNLASVVQEVIDRDGWVSGNSLTLFMTGEDQGASLLDNARDFESFENIEDPDDGGDGLHHAERIPTLKIYTGLDDGPSEQPVSIIEAIHLPFEVCPNPTSNGILNITFTNSLVAIVKIYSISGNLVYTSVANSDKLVINTENFKSGLYILNIIQNNNMYTEKVIIK